MNETAKIKSGFHKKNFHYANCSKCNNLFTTICEVLQEVYPTKAELIEVMKDYGWVVKGNTVLCEHCK